MDYNTLRSLFHENTKNYATHRWYDDGEVPDSWTEIEYRTYPRCPSIEITYPDLDRDQKLQSVLENRASPETVTAESVDLDDLFAILRGAKETHHRNDYQLRAYPSGGARFPVEVFVSTASVTNLQDGVYHFSVAEDELERVKDTPIQEKLASMSVSNKPETAPIVVILTAVLDRTEEKYGIRGYRYAHLSAGHLMQNLLLCAEATELAGRPWGDIRETEVDNLLPLSDEETTIYAALCGYPE
jgi:SagB-type dehydrogenase family enzyme